MIKLPMVSIIIACRSIDGDTKKCIKECLQLDYQEIEILVLPDYGEATAFDKIVVIPTGPVKPSLKRNRGMKTAKGDIFAFIDSDAYPRHDWLSNAVRYFSEDQNIGAVTGPNVTPSEDSFLQKAGGNVLESFTALGGLSRRYKITANEFETKDIMSCNFIYSREVAEALPGFDETILTGEDYKLGIEIIAFGKKIIYSPEVCVFHHRRPLFVPHLKQLWNYGRDKGILMHEIFSMDKLMYFLPSALTLWIFFGFIASLILGLGHAFGYFYCFVILLYLGIVTAAGMRIEVKKRSPFVIAGIVLTHISYGAGFLKGFCAQNPVRNQNH